MGLQRADRQQRQQRSTDDFRTYRGRRQSRIVVRAIPSRRAASSTRSMPSSEHSPNPDGFVPLAGRGYAVR